MLHRVVDGVYIVSWFPALYLEEFRALVVADIHLGFEEEMAQRGVFLPRAQLKRAIDVIERCLGIVDAERLIIAGDLKHLFSKLGRRERRDVVDFLEYVRKRFREILLVRGNHDTFVYVKLRDYGVELVDKLWLRDILVVHGHRELDSKDSPRVVIMGHEHPSIPLRDPLGPITKVPCFLVAPLARGCIAIVVPALGMYQSGTSISTTRSGYLSPILRKEADLENAYPIAVIEGEGVFELPRLADIESFLNTATL